LLLLSLRVFFRHTPLIDTSKLCRLETQHDAQ
jgi:hypothetical protein